MRTLTDPILHDCARIIERHPDLSPDYKIRLLNGLDSIDTMLEHAVVMEIRPLPESDQPHLERAVAPILKGAKR